MEHISFTVPRGSVVGIIGGTGSGKSSLVSLIPHFYDVKDGRVSVFGKNVCAYDNEDLRHRIGYVQQKAVLFQARYAAICCGATTALLMMICAPL